ncbi:MAG TPA: FAD-dependent oxidoreductase [Caulobacteraceae bacterium]|nr:FAD-dependent oxidoreductase [Caulobacteraceae bacterium]
MSEATSQPTTPTAERLSVRCCIAGGGPAGMMAAYLLARAGVEVLVLEKHADFLRDFRGDTVHPSTMQALCEVGLLERFLERPHVEVSQVVGQVGPDTLHLADLSHLPTAAKFVALMPQWDFLDFLSGEAKRFAEFALRMSTEARELLEEGGEVVGLLAQSATGPLEIRADLVIVADGRDSRFRAKAGFPVEDIAAPIDVLWMRLPRHRDDRQAVLGRIGPGYVLVLIDRGDYYQSAFVVQKGGYDAIRSEGLDAFRQRLARADPLLADRTDALKSWDDVKLLTVTVDRLAQWSRPGLLAIGDAAHAMSPVGGVGINLAIQDAVAAANLLAAPLGRGRPTPQDLARVQHRRLGPVRAMQAVQVAVHRFVLSAALTSTRPFRAPLPARMFNWFPILRRIPAHVIGMGFRMEHVRTPDVHAG